MSNYRAVRIQKGSKHVVRVLDETGAIVAEAGGARASRAQAVIFTKWERNPEPGIFGLRADVAAAQAEAARLTQSTTRIRSGHRMIEVPCRAAQWAQALLVTES